MTDAFPWFDPYHVSLKYLAVPSSGHYRNHSMCRQCLIYFNFVSQSESECHGYLHPFQTVADYVGIPVKHSNIAQPAGELSMVLRLTLS